jgi:hypothetical protein
VKLDWNSGALAQGLACYSGAKFFEAHEHWETAWLALEEPEKGFVQALIQMAAAFHHLHAGNRDGAMSLLGRAGRRLSKLPPNFGGIAVAPLRAEIAEWLSAFENGTTTPHTQPAIVPADQASWPNISPESPSAQR